MAGDILQLNRTPIKFNFRNDWEQIVRIELQRLGYKLSNKIRLDELTLKFYLAKERNIEARPRKILKASNFNCPPELHDNLADIEARINEGKSLRPYLHKKIKSINYPDHLLFDWGIHHLHIGKLSQNASLSERSKELLFCHVARDEIFFIGVFDHRDWGSQEILDIVDDNWPYLLERYELKGILPADTTHTSAEVNKLRKSGISTNYTSKDKRVYVGPGGGLTTDGMSLKAIQLTMNALDQIGELGKKFYQSWRTETTLRLSKHNNLLYPIRYRLLFINGSIYFFDCNNDRFIPYYDSRRTYHLFKVHIHAFSHVTEMGY